MKIELKPYSYFRQICQYCKGTISRPEDVLEFYKQVIYNRDDVTVYTCKVCSVLCDCGCTANKDEVYHCIDCGDTLCPDHTHSNDYATYCEECSGYCETCDSTVASENIRVCRRCEDTMCTACERLANDGSYCRNCK